MDFYQNLNNIAIVYEEHSNRALSYDQLLLAENSLGDIHETDSFYCNVENEMSDLEKTIVEYEMRFRRKAPVYQGSEKELLMALKNAITFNTPLFDYFFNIELIKAAYKKRFNRPITDYELSITGIQFWYGGHPGAYEIMNINMTMNGIFADYEPSGYFWLENREIQRELNIYEWLDFVNALYKCRISEWEKDYNEISEMRTTARENKMFNGRSDWELKIFFRDKHAHRIIGSMDARRNYNAAPSTWNEFRKEINDIGAKIKKGIIIKD